MTTSQAVPLRDFLASVEPVLDLPARRRVVDRAIVLLDQLYAHLALKRTMFVVDPIGRLEHDRVRLESLEGPAFHREMLSIFTELRDRHTLYLLPEPYRGRVAWLPFLLEDCHEDQETRILVTHVAADMPLDAFRPGVRVTHWNGVPIMRAVEIAAERYYGSTEAASLANGLSSMTIRPLDSALWPDGDWVVVSFEGLRGEAGERRVPWMVSRASSTSIEVAHDPSDIEHFAEGLDRSSERGRSIRKALFGPKAADAPERAAPPPTHAPDETPAGPSMPGVGGTAVAPGQSRLPDNFSFRTVQTAAGELGYVRIWSFDDTTTELDGRPIPSFVDAFASEFERIVSLLPPDGLIIDIRGNPGGRIPAAERVIELLSPRPITPMPMQFRSTPLVAELCRRAPAALELDAWSPSIDLAAETGAVYSRGLPLLPFARRYNQRGQRYYGPVVLIVDAHCYGAADIFAASFQDHGLGPLLGIDGTTGAGGANVWTYEMLARVLDDRTLPPLPGGVSFCVAVRSATRIGQFAGMALENLGVVPDALHQMTRADLFESNRDLIERATQLLGAAPRRTFDARLFTREDGTPCVRVHVRAVDRLDVYADGRPITSVDLAESDAELEVPAGSHEVEINGYYEEARVARALLTVDEPR